MAKLMLLFTFVVVVVDLILFGVTTDAVRDSPRIRSNEFVRCPASYPIEHGSLRVVSQDDLDVNAVYVKFGRPQLQIVRRFESTRKALEVVDSRLLSLLDERSKPIYLVDNSMNLNGTRCDIICCQDEKGALAFQDTARFSDSCSRLEVDDGARCELKWLERIYQGVCQSRSRTASSNEQWIECQANVLFATAAKHSQQSLEQTFSRQVPNSNDSQPFTSWI